MRFQALAALAGSLLITACQLGSKPTLNSERIEARFGSYGIEVVEQEPIRVSLLYSTHEGERVCRTLALVQFTDPPAVELAEVLTRIRGGASLGATLKSAGWEVEKRYVQLTTLPAGPRFLELARLDPPQTLATAVYRLNANRGGVTHPVATVVEIHHPDYLDPEQLRRTCPNVASTESDAATQRLLAIAIEKISAVQED